MPTPHLSVDLESTASPYRTPAVPSKAMEAPVAVITLAARGIASPGEKTMLESIKKCNVSHHTSYFLLDSAENVQLPTLQQDAGKGNSARGHMVCRLMCAGLVREMEALVAVRTLAQAVSSVHEHPATYIVIIEISKHFLFYYVIRLGVCTGGKNLQSAVHQCQLSSSSFHLRCFRILPCLYKQLAL